MMVPRILTRWLASVLVICAVWLLAPGQHSACAVFLGMAFFVLLDKIDASVTALEKLLAEKNEPPR